MVLAKEQWADKGKPLAYKLEGQRAFDEQETEKLVKRWCAWERLKVAVGSWGSDISKVNMISNI